MDRPSAAVAMPTMTSTTMTSTSVNPCWPAVSRGGFLGMADGLERGLDGDGAATPAARGGRVTKIVATPYEGFASAATDSPARAAVSLRAAAADRPACAHTPPCAGPHRAGAAARCATTGRSARPPRFAAALRCARRCTRRAAAWAACPLPEGSRAMRNAPARSAAGRARRPRPRPVRARDRPRAATARRAGGRWRCCRPCGTGRRRG